MTKSAERILLVEDEPVIAMDLEDELQDNGYEVVVASTISRARMALQSEAIAFCVLDVRLHNDTTFGLARKLDELGVPFIFLSGNDASALPPDLADRTILSKPVQMKQVLCEIVR